MLWCCDRSGVPLLRASGFSKIGNLTDQVSWTIAVAAAAAAAAADADADADNF